ncbi:ankyrin repeat-containing domain protein [Aspergillus aurantiobrunneus]
MQSPVDPGSKEDCPAIAPDSADGQSQVVLMREGTSDVHAVLVQGVSNIQISRDEQWRAWQPRIERMGVEEGHSVWIYEYDVGSNDPVIMRNGGIEAEAINLLDGLMQHIKQRITGESRFLFFALDIGGVIIKQALTFASLDPVKYSHMAYLTCGLVFANCPHRPSTLEELEDFIGALLSLSQVYPSNSIRKIRTLAKSILETNSSFLETKVLIRAAVCNIISGTLKGSGESNKQSSAEVKDDLDDSDEENDFINIPSEEDSATNVEPPSTAVRPCFYFGLPFELVYRSNYSYSKLLMDPAYSDMLIMSQSAFDAIRAALTNCRQTVMDQTLHCVALYQAPPMYPPDVLYSSEFLPDVLDGILNSEVYNKWSQQRGLRVIHLQGTSGVSTISQLLNQRLNGSGDHDRNPTPNATLYFEFSRSDVRRNNIQAMLSAFVAALVSRFCHEYSGWFKTYLDERCRNGSWGPDDLLQLLRLVRDTDGAEMVTFMLARLDECDESRTWFLNKISAISTRIRVPFAWMITTQGSEDLTAAMSQWPTLGLDGWMAGRSLSGCAVGLGSISPASDTATPFWLHHAMRPLTPTETATMVGLQGSGTVDDADNSHGLPSSLPATSHDSGLDSRPSFIQSVESQTTHRILACRCLQYLCNPAVQENMREFCSRYMGLDQAPIAPSHEHLISYATLFWPMHYQFSGKDRPFEQALELFSDPGARNAWSQVYYILSNPVTRINRCYISPLPLMAMLGLDDLITEWSSRNTAPEVAKFDYAFALSEAARHGHTSTAQILLNAAEVPASALREAIAAAAGFGSNGTLQVLVEHALQIDGFAWPPELLHRVAQLGLHDAMKPLLSSGINPNSAGENYREKTPLHLASLWGHYETVRLLLEAHADTKSKSNTDTTPLHTCAAFDNPRTTKLLIDYGADMEAQDSDRMTPLQTALQWGNMATFEVLLQEGANPNHGKDAEGDDTWASKPLVYCAIFADIEGAELLLKHKVDINCALGRCSAFYLALDYGCTEIARMILEHSADLDYKPDPNENPNDYDLILLRAVSNTDGKSMEMTKLLFDHGARVDEVDNSSTWRGTALTRASGIANAELLKYLIDKGANVDFRGVGSTTPLYTAVSCGLVENVELLLNAGASFDGPQSFDAKHPIHASCDYPVILKMLLAKGADINAMSEGSTPLHQAVANGNAESVKILVKHHAQLDLEAQGDFLTGYTALDIACQGGDTRIIRLLLEAGANREHTTKAGKRPLHLCVESGSLAATRALLEYRVAIDYRDSDGNAAVHRISNLTPKSILKLLVHGGADLHVSNNDQVTPLQKAVEVSNTAVVRYLLSRNANPNKCSAKSTSLLHIASRNRDLPTAKALVQGGIDVQRADSIPNAPALVIAAVGSWTLANQDLVEYLVESCNININGTGGFLQHPVATACCYGHADQVEYLLKHGANPDAADTNQRRALHIGSLYRGGPRLVDTLVSSKAQTTEPDGSPLRDIMGKTAVHYAASSGNWDTFERVIALYDEKEQNKPDNDGWTPFLWALLNPDTDSRIVEHLLNQGADVNARVSTGRRQWSPLKLGRYIGVSDTILSLLVPKSPTGLPGEDQLDDAFHNSKKARFEMYGIDYSCSECEDYHLCFRCYASRATIHPSHPGDYWIEAGPEYVDESASEVGDNGDTGTIDEGPSRLGLESVDSGSETGYGGSVVEDNHNSEGDREDQNEGESIDEHEDDDEDEDDDVDEDDDDDDDDDDADTEVGNDEARSPT